MVSYGLRCVMSCVVGFSGLFLAGFHYAHGHQPLTISFLCSAAAPLLYLVERMWREGWFSDKDVPWRREESEQDERTHLE